MPTYVFKCQSCGNKFDQYRPLSNFSRQAICDCGGLSSLVVTPPNIQVFNSYTEHNMTREPIHINSAKQRDALCEKHGVSYDSVKYVRAPREVGAVDSVTLDDVKKAIHEKTS